LFSDGSGDANVNDLRLILAGLLCGVPAILLLDGLIVQGIVAATLSGAIVITAAMIRPGEADFLRSLVLPLAVPAAVPILWMLLQIIPLKSSGLAHPIWQSAEQALGRPLSGSVSIDPGMTLLTLGQYLCMVAVVLLSAAVAVDRQRAEWILFALVVATALVAAVMICHDILGLNVIREDVGLRAQARTCVALGLIVSVAAAIRTYERYETGKMRPDRSPATLVPAFVICGVALALCVIALALDLTGDLMFAAAYGLGLLLAVPAIRRIGFGIWGSLAILAVAGAIGIALIGTRSGVRNTDLTLAFAAQAPNSMLAITQRILADVPWMGTGAGTFSLLLPIYRDAGDTIIEALAPTAAAEIAIELGRPLLWATVVTLMVGIFVLLRGALERGRDSFYPAAGASALILLLLLGFCDKGVLGTPVGICAAAILGLAIAQRQSRTIA
jgi:hypothetical protein